MLERQNMKFIEDMLKGDSYPLGHGYCALILRSEKDIEEKKSINDKIKEEAEFFKKFNLRPAGVIQLRKMISDIQYGQIKNQIPNLLVDIDREIVGLKDSQTFMCNLINNDQKKLVSKLRMMIEKLVGSSLERAEFEERLKKEFAKIIGKYLKKHFHALRGITLLN